MFTLYHLDSQSLLAPRAMFADGKAASRAARLLSRKTGSRYQPRKHESESNADWRARERARFNDGEYTSCEMGLAFLAYQFNKDMFPHVAKKRPDLIAYTKNEEKGRADKQSLMSVAAFVEMVTPNCDSDERAAIVSLHMAWANAHEGLGFTLATTPDDIARAYINYDRDSRAVSSSCMRYEESHWARVDGARYHPARVYGAGDLALAFMANDEGRTIARAIVWPEKKLYSRVYADNDSLHNALKKAGYKPSYYHDSSNPGLDGARLLRVENDNGRLVCPYIDEMDRVIDDGEYLVLDDNGGLSARETSGETGANRGFCEMCEDDCDGDDMQSVFTSANRRNTMLVCAHCAENSTFYCNGYNETFSDSVDQCEIDGRTYCQEYAENNASYCEYDGEYTFEDTVEVVIDGERGYTETWRESTAENDAYQYEGVYYSEFRVDSCEVVTVRYVAEKGIRYNGALHCFEKTGLVFYKDETITVPAFMADNGEVDCVYDAASGRYYMRGYIDHYPVARARLDIAPLEHEDSETILWAA